MVEKWQELVADKQKRQKETIPNEWIVQTPPADRLNVIDFPRETGLLSDFELEITESNVEALLPKLASGEWSSVNVTRAFYKRAIIAHQVVNCLTEIFVDKALARAAYLDEQLKTTGKPVGPLHGLPISLKDQIAIKDLETVMGYVSWIGNYATQDAVLVDILYGLGAVPFVRTNVPQTLMWAETFNNVFGRTSNPYNRSLTSGGSSGGEGALIAMKGSPLGVGSDMGGSIRIPSAFNGLYGLRPSYNRIPYRGSANSLEGIDSHPSVLGPMTNSMDGIKTFMKSVIGAKPWKKDPLAVNQPWKDGAYDLVEYGGGKQLVFGIIWDDRTTKPHPPIIRGLEMTRDALLKAGHKVVDWKPHKHADLVGCTRAIWRAGASEDYAAVISISGEPLITTMNLDPKGPVSSKTMSFRPLPQDMSAYGLWQVHKMRASLRGEYLDHWNKTVDETGTGRPVDAIIAPAAAWAAPPHGKNWSADYTTVWNGLDYPGLIIPVTTVDPTLDKVKPPHKFLSPEDEEAYKLYKPETFKDAPVSVQIIGRTGEDEAVIAIGEIVDKALKEYKH